MSRKKQKISATISEKRFTKVENKNAFGAFKGKEEVYLAKEVDGFLGEIEESVRELENFTKKIYDENEELKESGLVIGAEKEEITQQRKVQQVESQHDADLQRHKEEVSKRVEAQTQGEPDGISKVQKQMVAFLEQAEQQSLEILKEAMIEKEQMRKDAEHQARKIVAEAMNQANEEKRRAQERMDQTREASRIMEQRAEEIQRDIMRRAHQLDEFGKEFEQFSANLKNVAEDVRKRA